MKAGYLYIKNLFYNTFLYVVYFFIYWAKSVKISGKIPLDCFTVKFTDTAFVPIRPNFA